MSCRGARHRRSSSHPSSPSTRTRTDAGRRTATPPRLRPARRSASAPAGTRATPRASRASRPTLRARCSWPSRCGGCAGAPSATRSGAAPPAPRSARCRTSRAGGERGGTGGVGATPARDTRRRSGWGRPRLLDGRDLRTWRGGPRGCAASCGTASTRASRGRRPASCWPASRAGTSRGSSRGRGCRCAAEIPPRGRQWRARAGRKR